MVGAFLAFLVCFIGSTLAGTVSYNELVTLDGAKLETYFKTPSSLKSWNSVDTPKRFAITSMVVEHSKHAAWYVPALHQKYSSGWNRTTAASASHNHLACNIRFFGVGLESTLEGFQTGGTGYLTIGFSNAGKRELWHGFDKNETNRVHCYYNTNKDTGSEFIVRPAVFITCQRFYSF